jgi:hypothetical protein
MKTYTKILTYLLSLSCTAAIMHCSPLKPEAGNSSQTGNPVASMLYNPDGSPAVSAKVCFYRHDDDPRGSHAVDSTSTDAHGNYSKKLDTGTYNILATLDTVATFQDSIIVTQGDTTRPPADTLRSLGSISGKIELQGTDDPRTVFILFMGSNTFTRPTDTQGNFTATNMAKGKYPVTLLTTLDDYDVMDTSFVITAGRDSVIPQPIVMRYTGIPVPKGLRIEYDSMKQIVTLYWNKPTTGSPVQSYTVYRKHSDSASFVSIKAGVTDTTCSDSTGVQDQTYEYRVAVVDTSTMEGVRSAGVSVIIASAYHLIDSVYHFGTGVGQFYNASCVAVDSFGNIYVGDAAKNEVLKYDSLGNYITSMGVHSPIDIRIDSANNVYVASYYGNMIFKFNSSADRLLLSWGGSGNDTGKFNGLNRMYIHGNQIYVCEEGNSRIQIFDLDGNYISQFTHTEGFNNLRGVCVVNSDIIVLTSLAIYQFNHDHIYQNTILSWSPLTDYAAWFSNLNDSLFIYYSLSQKINHFDFPSKATISIFNLQSKPITLHSFMINKDKKIYLVSTRCVYIYSYSF